MSDDTMAAFARDVQASLWTDLDEALRNAINGVWSMKAAYIAQQIVTAARLVGPTPWGECPWTLVAGDVYSAVLRAGNLTPDLPKDEAEWERTDQLMASHGGTRETLLQQFTATVAAIETDREMAWIRGDG